MVQGMSFTQAGFSSHVAFNFIKQKVLHIRQDAYPLFVGLV